MFPFHTSPVFPVTKHSHLPWSDPAQKFRMIHNLSAPYQASVNQAISDDLASVSYTSFDDVMESVAQAGLDVLLTRFDIENAFRLLPVRPEDQFLLGFEFEGGFYYDRVLPFGCRLSCNYFEKFASFLQWLLETRLSPPPAIFRHYLDDFLGIISVPSQAQAAVDIFLEVAADINLPLAHHKHEPPSRQLQFLGLILDMEHRILSVPAEKQIVISDVIGRVLAARKVTLKQLQSLLGRLSFAGRVVFMARPFLRRTFRFLTAFRRKHHHLRLPPACRRDLQMWQTFMSLGLGPCWIDKTRHSNFDLHLFADASASHGFGVTCGTNWAAEAWGPHFGEERRANQISFLEFFPLVCAFFLWPDQLRDKNILIHSDNQGVVDLIHRRTSPAENILALLRAWVVQCVGLHVEVRAVHLPGTHNAACDHLSRGRYQKFFHLRPDANPSKTSFPQSLWQLGHPSV